VDRCRLAALLAFGCFLSRPALAAQEPSVARPFELAAGPAVLVSYRANWGLQLGLRWQLPGEFGQLGIRVVSVLGPARSDSTGPGIAGAGLQLTLATRDPRSSPAPTVLFSFGIGLTRLDAHLQEAKLAPCTPSVLCMVEGIPTYHSGTYLTWEPGLALVMPLSARVALAPEGRVLITRKNPNWGKQVVATFSVGVAWHL